MKKLDWISGSPLQTAFAGFFAMALAMGIGRFFYTPVLPPMLEAGRLTAAEAGLAAGANFLGYLLGALAASSSFFERHRQRWMLAALATVMASTAASGLWAGFGAFAAVRFVAGVASAFSMIFISAIVLRRIQELGRADLISVHFAGVGFGIVLSALVVPAVLAMQVSWSGMWFAAAFAGLFLLFGVFVLIPGSSSGPETASAGSEIQSGRSFSAAFWALLVGYGFFGFGYSVSATFINTIAKADAGLISAEPWVWLVVGIAGIPSTWAWNNVATRFGLARTYSFACAVEAAGILLLLWYPTPLNLLISGVTLGGTFMAVTALGLAKSRSLAPRRAATALALMTASFGLGQMAGPVLAGFLYDSTGSFALALTSAMAALGVTIAFTLLSRRLEA